MGIDRFKLVAWPARRSITQPKIADLAVLRRATVNYTKSGKSCSDEVGKKIAGALGVPVEKLIED